MKKNGKSSAAQQAEPAQGTEAAAEEKAHGQGTESGEAAAAEATSADAATGETAEQQQPVPDEIEEKEGTDFLKVALTVDERLGLGDEVSRLYAQKQSLETRLAGISKQMKGEIAKLDDSISEALGTLRDGGRYDNVKIKAVKNWRLGTFEKVRLDTGEVYSTRALTGEERQQKLFEERAASAAAAEASGDTGDDGEEDEDQDEQGQEQEEVGAAE
jgi:hypothetical protein